eukprot:3206469-Prymnesium_polylepis.1
MPLVDKSAAERRAARARGRPLFGEDTRHGHAAQAGRGAGGKISTLRRSVQKRGQKTISISFWVSDSWNLA